MASGWAKVKAAVGLAPPPEPELPQTLPQQLLQQIDDATTLTWRQRAIGFGCSFGGGLVLAFMSFISLSTFNLTGFAVMYSLGSLMAMVSTCFLVGPKRQVKNMFENHRLLATAVYLLAIAATLAIAFSVSGILGVVGCIVTVVLQFLAAGWYAVTYIPGGQDCLKGLVIRK